jgi:23S rRNA (pseudouridine1915-N3)-methyltransferase
VKITVVSFQKNLNRDLAAAEAEYLKRLGRYAKVDLRQIKQWDQNSVLPDSLVKGARCIGLFIDGKSFSSEELAGTLQRYLNQGHSRLVLVIGGPEGMPAAVAAQIDVRWSLSSLTFSHQLVRLLLLEALYRSFDLLHGGRYHK